MGKNKIWGPTGRINYEGFRKFLSLALYNIPIPTTGPESYTHIPFSEIDKLLKERAYFVEGSFELRQGFAGSNTSINVYTKNPNSHILISYEEEEDKMNDIWTNNAVALSDLKAIFSKKKEEITKQFNGSLSSLEAYLNLENIK